MGRRKQPSIPSYLYDDTTCGNFAMIPPDLYECKQFQALSHAARNFYVLLAVHACSQEQKQCLYQTLRAYNDILELGLNDEDIRILTWGNKRMHKFSTLFVIPEKHLKGYGYSNQYANKLKKQLIDAGFIAVKYGGKGKYTGWSKNVTVYEFCDKWKSKHS